MWMGAVKNHGSLITHHEKFYKNGLPTRSTPMVVEGP